MDNQKSLVQIIFYSLLLIIFLLFLHNVKFKLTNEISFMFGYSTLEVLSGSMEPTFRSGDLIIIKKANVNKLKKDDIITYQYNDVFVTHRIFDIDDHNQIVTKGDDNDTYDQYITDISNVIGVYQFKIPNGATVVNFMTSIYGVFIFLLGYGTILLIDYTYKKSKNSI